MGERCGAGRKGIAGKPAIGILLLQRPIRLAHCSALKPRLPCYQAGTKKRPAGACIICVGDAVVLTAPPTTVGILPVDQPDAGAHRCREAFRVTKVRMSCEQAVDDLTGIEDDGLAAGFTVMSRKSAIHLLKSGFPSDHAMRTVD